MSSYIPPHKRHSKGSPSPAPTPVPESLNPTIFRRTQNLNSFGRRKDSGGKKKYVYAKGAVSKWFSVGLADDSQFSSLFKLEPVPIESFEPKSGENPLSLVLLKGCSEGTREFTDKPWLLVAEKVKQDLLLAFQNVKCEMEESDMNEVKPVLVARFGKIHFYRSSSNRQEPLTLNESTLRQLRKTFCTNVPPSYVEYTENLVSEKYGLKFEEEKELYYVKLSDNLRPDSIVSCKCVVDKDHKKIQLHKIELNQVRHMVADMSCLGKSLDLRLMLCTTKIMMALSDEEINGMKDLIGSAVLDTEVKGGLRWPFGKDSSGGRFTVIGVWHTIAKSCVNSSIKFKLRHADRFDFRSSTGEVSREINLKMPGIVSLLRKQTIEENLVFEMLEDNLKLIWDHCLPDGSSS